MAKSISVKCLECSELTFRKKIDRRRRPKCYNGRVCIKKRVYYRRLEHYRKVMRDNHRYIRHRVGQCSICASRVNLEAHHIQRQLECRNDDANNIITLCHNCHWIITVYNRLILHSEIDIK